MYDTHCHLNFQAFKGKYKEVIQRSLDKGMLLNIVGSQYETSQRAIEISHEFEKSSVYASVGLHPTHLEKKDKAYEWNFEKYKQLARDPKVVAIGETGIDYFHGTENLEKQRKIFSEHIALAKELKKALIIHCRPAVDYDAYEDLINLLTQTESEPFPGVVHCFLGDWNIAQAFLNLNLFISFTGIITFKNTDSRLIEAVTKIPLESIMIETDAPYLTPEPYRGRTQNEPLHVEFVAKKIADLKGVPYEKVILSTTNNGKKLFLNL